MNMKVRADELGNLSIVESPEDHDMGASRMPDFVRIMHRGHAVFTELDVVREGVDDDLFWDWESYHTRIRVRALLKHWDKSQELQERRKT